MTPRLRGRPTHVLFDLDGVLLDTEPAYTRATREVVAPYGKVFDWSVKADMIGRGQLDGARHLVRALDLPISATEYLRRRRPKLLALLPDVAAIPGAEAFVRALRGRGVPLAVATSADRGLTELKIAPHCWFDAFEVIVCGDDDIVGEPKPAPDIYLATAEMIGARPAGCVVIEDSLAGVQAGKAAGMQVIALPDPQMDAARYGSADLVIRSYSELSIDDLGF